MDHSDIMPEPAVAEADPVDAPENSQDTTEEALSTEEELYPDDQSQPEDDEGEDTGRQPEDEPDDEGDEPEPPTIDAPGLKAEERERFGKLAAEDQKFVSDLLQRRHVEAKTGVETARTAQREAERTAADTAANAQRTYAQRAEAVLNFVAPKPPSPELAQTDLGAFIHQQAIYEQKAAEWRGLVQHVQALNAEVDTHFTGREQEWDEEQLQQIASIPEFADDATREAFVTDIEHIGRELGYTPEALAQADARDIFALNKVRQLKTENTKLKADAGKWRAHVAKRNERPRAAAGRFSSAPAGGRTAGQTGQTSVLSALYPND